MPKYAKQIKSDVNLVTQEVAAIAKVTAASTGDPDQTKITDATNAVNAVKVKAFADYWLPKLPKVAADGTVAEANGTVEEVKNATPAQQAQAKVTGGAPAANAQQAAGSSTTAAAAARSTQRTTTSSSAAAPRTTTPSRPAATQSAPAQAASKPAAPVQKPVVAITPIGNGGLFNTMDEAYDAMVAASDAASRPAHAYTVVYTDGSEKYSWEWIK